MLLSTMTLTAKDNAEIKNRVDACTITFHDNNKSLTLTQTGLTPMGFIDIKVMYGDANNDQKIISADATLSLCAAAKLIIWEEQPLTAADVTGDLKATSADATLILCYAAKWIAQFLVEQ